MAFDGITKCGKYCSQAEKAAAHARQRRRDLLLFEDCALFLLCELIQSEYDMMDFTHPAVTALMKADAKTGSELLATQKYYIFYSNAPGEAARVLNIHRNTLFYRINKIREMTGISFDTVEDTFRIYLSIRLLETSGAIDIGGAGGAALQSPTLCPAAEVGFLVSQWQAGWRARNTIILPLNIQFVFIFCRPVIGYGESFGRRVKNSSPYDKILCSFSRRRVLN